MTDGNHIWNTASPIHIPAKTNFIEEQYTQQNETILHVEFNDFLTHWVPILIKIKNVFTTPAISLRLHVNLLGFS